MSESEPRAYGWESADEQCHHGYIWPAIQSLLPPGRLRVLDAGCGNGVVASRIAALGHEVVGIDAAPDGIAHARKAHPSVRFEVVSAYDDLTSVAPEGGFDAIVASEVIEHLYEPQAFLRNVFKHVRPRGALILTTPYHGYVKNLALSLFDGWDKHHTVDWVGGHIKFFSEKTIAKMLVEAGFRAPVFRNAGRLPLLWKSLVCRSDKP